MFTIKVDSDLRLHLFQPHDAGELFQLVSRNRDYLRKWLPWVEDLSSEAQVHSIILMWLNQYYENSLYNFAIKYKGILAGSISLHGIDWINSHASIGYYLAETMQGKGILTTAAKALITHSFRDLRLNRIEIRCAKGNVRSQAIPEKLGFYREGIIRDGEFVNNRFHDLIVYGLLAREWFYRA